jgi:hypothetical protein
MVDQDHQPQKKEENAMSKGLEGVFQQPVKQ